MRTPIQALLIEDNPGDVRLVREWLQASRTAEYRLEHADRLSAGQKRLKEGRFDVVLVDLGLPDSQGLDTLRRVRAAAPESAVLAFTGLEDEQVGLQAVKEGAQDYLLKGELDGPLLDRSIAYALERKRMQDALSESERKHRTLFETMAQGVVYQSSDGEIVSANPAAERILGLRLDQMRGRTSVDSRWRAIHEDGSDFPGEEHASMVALQTGREVHDVVMGVFNPQTDSYRWIEINAVPQFRPDGGEPYEVFTTFDDITKRKRAEDAVRAQAEVLQTVFDNVPMMIGFFGPSGRAEYVNRAWEQILGWSLEETRSRDLFVEFYPDEEDRARVVAFMSEASGEWRDFRTHVRDGRMLDTTWANVRLSDGRTVGIGMDITDRKRAEEELRRSRTELAQILDNIVDVVFLLGVEPDDTYRFLSVNGSFLTITGLDAEDVIGKRIQEVLPEAAHALALGKYQEAIRERKTARWLEVSVYPAGEKVGDVSVTPIFDERGRCTHLVGTVHDITERKQAEDAAREQTEIVQAIVDNIPMMLVFLDASGHIQYWNRACEQIDRKSVV